MAMVSLSFISRRNRMFGKTRRIQTKKSLVDSLLVLTVLGLLIQLDIGIDTEEVQL